MTVFMDDTTEFNINFFASLADQCSIKTLIIQTLIAAEWWAFLLYVTGGKLELPKCFFYAII